MYTIKERLWMREIIALERALVKGNIEETTRAMANLVTFNEEGASFEDMDIDQYNDALTAILQRVKTGRTPSGN
jgi:hypothetical protein